MRLARIEDVDINRFEFDLDLTMMIFFLNPDGKVYARYGGRDSEDADNRQSLAGLRYTMESVLAMHKQVQPLFAEPTSAKPLLANELGKRRKGCMHCHIAKEMMYTQLASQGKWTRDLVWRYPPPDNLGIVLDVNRGNVIKQIKPESSGAKLGLKPGDKLQLLNKVPIHSFGDAQFALDRAPTKGSISVSWLRAEKTLTGDLNLPEGWRQADYSWRASMRGRVPSLHVNGKDLTPAEKDGFGLPPNQVAFRQADTVHSHARKAGVQAGDIILGIDDRPFTGTADAFLQWVRGNYVVGDRVLINVMREGRRLTIPMTLIQ